MKKMKLDCQILSIFLYLCNLNEKYESRWYICDYIFNLMCMEWHKIKIVMKNLKLDGIFVSILLILCVLNDIRLKCE